MTWTPVNTPVDVVVYAFLIGTAVFLGGGVTYSIIRTLVASVRPNRRGRKQ